MKVRKKVIIGATVMLLTMSSPFAWSHPNPNGDWRGHWFKQSHWSQHKHWFQRENGKRENRNRSRNNASGPSVAPAPGPSVAHAPEIDAASGTSAFALLTGILLLVGERFRGKYPQNK